MSENSIEFSLSNSEQRDSWLNSGHRTLDTDNDKMTNFSGFASLEKADKIRSTIQGHKSIVPILLSL